MSRKLIHLVSLISVLSMANIAPAQLVGHWRFDEGTGTITRDSSGNGHDGSFEGSTTWVRPGWDGVGSCLQFGGAGDRVTIEPFDLTGSGITLAAWVNVTNFQDDARLISKSEGSGTADHYWAMILSGGGENNLEFRLRTDTGATTRTSVPDSEDLQADEWTHIAVTWDASDPFMRFYKNGQEIFSQSKAGNAVGAGPDVKIALGNQSASVADAAGRIRPFGGLMDDVVVYDRALDPEELEAVMSGLQAVPHARKPDPADGAIHAETWVNISWSAGDFAVSHDVYLGDNFEDVDNSTGDTFQGNQTDTFIVAGFPGFPFPEGLVAGTTYYWRIDEVNDTEPNSPWKGDVWSFSVPPKTAYNPNPADGAEFVDPNATFTWTPGFGSILHTAYIGTNFDDVSGTAGSVPQGAATFRPGPLEMEKVYYWRIDEFDAATTYKGDIWSFTTPGAVGNPQPANGAADVQMTANLSWTPADNAASHELYFGTDADAVKNATTASPEYIGPRSLGSESYDPGKLAWDAAYYWRVDEVYPTGTVKGLVWAFTTADFIIVDDFESYDDIDPLAGEPGVNRIFDKWIDGFGTTTNGAIVGNDLPPYAEQSIVHGGAQSLVYRYDNANKTSETTLTLVYPRDWTEQGVTKLSLWFRGAAANSAERMFVALNGNAVVYHDDPAATQIGGWNEWVIGLQAFAGVNLANVNTITIGIGTKNAPAAGGAGTMYFDDIRLYRPAATPIGSSLVAWCKLDDNADDSSGNGHNGTVEGAPTWISPGWDSIGSCMQFGGDDDRITLESFDVTGTGVTLAAWINVITFQDDARMVSKSQGSGTADHYWAIILSGSGEDNLECRLKTDTGATTRRTAPEGTDVPANEWTHVAVTWDAGDPFMRLYKNGIEIDSVSKDGIAVATAADVKIGIGNQSATVPGDGGIRPFGGLLDDVRVYNRGLSAAEILELVSQ